MKTTSIPPSKCAACGHEIEAVSSVGGDAAPWPGAWSFCIACCHLSIFDADLRLRSATEEEIATLARNEPESYRALMRSVSIARRMITNIENCFESDQGKRGR